MTRPFQGLRAWLLQRVTAVYLALFLVYVSGRIWISPPADFGAWRAWVAQPMVSAMLALSFVMLLGHAWVGVRDVLLDYVPNLRLRVALLTLVAVSLIYLGIWFGSILVRTLGS